MNNQRTFQRLRPILDRVLVKPDAPPQKIGLIYLPETVIAEAKQQIRRGTVVAIGPGCYDEKGRFHPTELKPGDTVEISQYAGEGRAAIELRIDGEDFLLMREEDIVGYIRHAAGR